MKVNQKVLKGLEHVYRFPLSSRNVKISTLHGDMTPGWLHLYGAVKVNLKVLEGFEHVHRFPLSSRNVNISKGTPYNLI